MESVNIELRRNVLLTFQVALLGMVTPSLRAVTTGWDDHLILARCLFDGPVGDEEREICSDIEAEIVASFPDHEVRVIAKRLDAPGDLAPELLKVSVFRRRE